MASLHGVITSLHGASHRFATASQCFAFASQPHHIVFATASQCTTYFFKVAAAAAVLHASSGSGTSFLFE